MLETFVFGHVQSGIGRVTLSRVVSEMFLWSRVLCFASDIPMYGFGNAALKAHGEKWKESRDVGGRFSMMNWSIYTWGCPVWLASVVILKFPNNAACWKHRLEQNWLVEIVIKVCDKMFEMDMRNLAFKDPEYPKSNQSPKKP
jgi:hypothetical protein